MAPPRSDPRSLYKDPESLRCDTSLPLEERQRLLTQWKDLLDERLNSEAEGMSAPSPMTAEAEGRIADEERRVSNALIAIEEEMAARTR
ncbi:hypothetical protein EKN06_09650 [Croceicoccus ponticola]|uniref:Uncharacterized protein n=1 Tax=Croceicoccus ponticola TaxID=2217664 RepID=A0A437GXM9_9SPHN|nr:hypothetical protein [Croceicoccus ponticola]RVQ67162.1 hypothetical protein EKN06_09650 [Croceicoccus ponticola]